MCSRTLAKKDGVNEMNASVTMRQAGQSNFPFLICVYIFFGALCISCAYFKNECRNDERSRIFIGHRNTPYTLGAYG